MQHPKPYRAILLVALGFVILAPLPSAHAHQPGTISFDLHRYRESGRLKFDTETKLGRGDSKIEFVLHNDDPDVDVLLKFPVCTYDGDHFKRDGGADKRVDSYLLSPTLGLEEILTDAGASEGLGTPHKPDPAWSLCITSRSKVPGVFLLRRGEEKRIKAIIDFRDPSSAHSDATGQTEFRLHVRTFVDVHAVDPDDGSALSEQILSSKRLPTGVLHEYLEHIDDARSGEGRFWLSMFYRVLGDPLSGKGEYFFSTYDELFLLDHEFSHAAGADEPAEGIPNVTEYFDGDAPVAVEDYLTYRQVMDETVEYDPEHADLDLIPTFSEGPEGGSLVCEEPNRSDCVTFGCSFNATSRLATSRAPQPRQSAFNLSGRFSSKWTDHALHPAWGWKAIAWWNNNGSWTKLAEGPIEHDGKWSLSFSHSGYTGQNLRMQYLAFNRFFEPMDKNENKYRWKGPDRTNISSSHNEGHWFANCDGTDTNGLGELYQAGYLLWNKMHWTAEINPLRSDPLKLFYPNTFYDCGSGSGNPWSCANCNGKLWLTAAHGTQDHVVQHELAHQVHYEFWDNHFPTGACGNHTICGKFNTGMALTEGYANFLPSWIQCSRNATSCSIGYGNLEAPGCTASDEEEREGWVAATFWDLYDSHADGQDVLWYNHEGAVQKLFLDNGLSSGSCCGGGTGATARGMSHYRTIYRNNSSSGHADHIDDIFEQNGTD